MITGLLLIAAALILQVYNLWDQYRADRVAAEQLAALNLVMEQRQTPDMVIDPDMEMPVVTVNGYDYVGTLEIPCIGISLPVMSEWSYPRLKVAPCRYQGSIYRGDMIIAAHNFKRHFGLLKNVPLGKLLYLPMWMAGSLCIKPSMWKICPVSPWRKWKAANGI